VNGPITHEERVAVTEHFYRRCYRTAVLAAIVVCAASIGASFLEQGYVSLVNLSTCCVMAIAIAAFGRESGYRLLRRYPVLAALPILLLVGPAHWWPQMDFDAVIFAALAPIALLACTAQRARDVCLVLALILVGIVADSFVDPHTRGYGHPTLIIANCVATALTVLLLNLTVHWSGLVVLSEATGPAAFADQEAAPLLEPPGPHSEIVAARVGRLSRTPLGVLGLEAAEELASWMRAIRELISSAQARRHAWYRATGFHARELQVLLLLSEHKEADVASYLGISVKTVRNTAVRALQRERRDLGGDTDVTRSDIARELAATYPTAEVVESLATEVQSLPG
jgi:DNA-binding CsgD family transcriptional regulator